MIYDRNKLAEMVSRCKWRWASTMIKVPHEYIHRDHCELTRDEFYYFVGAQRELGVHERWGNYNFPYLYLDGYKYWTMGDPFPTTFILNRQKVFGEFDFLEWPISRTYDIGTFRKVALSVVENFKGKMIFECGTGNSDFISYTKLPPQMYYGVDPSKKAINMLRSQNESYNRRCSVLSFEQAIHKWLSSDCVVIALFGAASYFMEPYLIKLVESGRDYFLMFYREGYCPKEFEEMHHFNYSKDDLVRIFLRNSLFDVCFYNSKDYIIVTNKKIEWVNPPPNQNELFPI